MKIGILVDNDSWILPFAAQLLDQLKITKTEVYLARKSADIETGDICFFLGCTQIVTPKFLRRNTHNLVVHESSLPEGRGFSPMSWQILDGKNEIPISLLDASEGVDEGAVWLEDYIELDGTELSEEWRELQGNKTVELCLRFVSQYHELHPTEQQGTPSYFPKRLPKDSELDVDKTIRDQFDLLRIVDNQRYPAYFKINGVTYELAIRKKEMQRGRE